MITKILIANRGEIARRIIKTAKKQGILTVGIYTSDEPNNAWADEADEKVFLSGNSLSETWLNADKIIALAHETSSNAIHPGYGFLSENASFARKCEEQKIIFIGPSADTIELMGDKLGARSFAKKAGVPLAFALEGNLKTLVEKAHTLPYPVIIKASAGGGGKGMHIVYTAGELKNKLENAQREASSWFGNGTVYVEQYFEEARHIEVQILGDNFGNVIHLYERECTLQRNYQKIIEEAPSPTLTQHQRETICEAAVKLAKAASYTNAGTIEFLWANNEFYFLEMNTRIQVEHPVTEMITGIDLVALQFAVSNNLPLKIGQKDVKINGVAVEARIYAEKPEDNFKPSAGILHHVKTLSHPMLRFDNTYESGNEVVTNYDGMIGKLIVHQKQRSEAFHWLAQCLSETQIHGVETNLSFLYRLVTHPKVMNNTVYTRFINNELEELNRVESNDNSFIIIAVAYAAAMLNTLPEKKNTWFKHNSILGVTKQTVLINGTPIDYKLITQPKGFQFLLNENMFNVFYHSLNNNAINLVIDGVKYKAMVTKGIDAFWVQYKNQLSVVRSQHLLSQACLPKKAGINGTVGDFEIKSPLHGKIASIMVQPGQTVEQGTNILTIDSMKTENHITSPAKGIVDTIWIEQDALVKENQLLMTFKN
jgi:acetyl/propionyl-CoA carboxylase alpha subunit